MACDIATLAALGSPHRDVFSYLWSVQLFVVKLQRRFDLLIVMQREAPWQLHVCQDGADLCAVSDSCVPCEQLHWFVCWRECVCARLSSVPISVGLYRAAVVPF